ncbi:hypothetical protein MW887_004583 [Aspergillus wentii]|nr:hypothetical protein MW887_004583 [Aspergillus wentii]
MVVTNTPNDTVDPNIAISPNAPHQLPQLVDTITAQTKAYNDGDAEARLKLVEAAQSLIYALETPREAMLRYCWAQSTAFYAIEVGIDLGLFSLLAHSEQPKPVSELASRSGAEPALVGRILKHLAAVGVVTETGMDEYQATRLSTTLAIKRFSDAWPFISGGCHSALQALPAYLRQTNYRDPTDGHNAPFQMGYRTDKPFFEYIHSPSSGPALATQFNNFMSVYHQGRPSWMDKGFYPVQERLLDGARTGDEDVLLVDVGGNKGHDTDEFRSKWPGTGGRLVLQDIPAVLDEAEGLNGVDVMVHDFFTEQPVKGARAYYLHSVLHDWPDSSCQIILSKLVGAMTPGYSKILINENIIPDTGAHWQATGLDMIMMVDVAARERTERQWRELVESVGLKIVDIWTVRSSVESLIECELMS